MSKLTDKLETLARLIGEGDRDKICEMLAVIEIDIQQLENRLASEIQGSSQLARDADRAVKLATNTAKIEAYQHALNMINGYDADAPDLNEPSPSDEIAEIINALKGNAS
jgi:hypothetical protein